MKTPPPADTLSETEFAQLKDYFRRSTLTPVRTFGEDAQSKLDMGKVIGGLQSLGPLKVLLPDDRLMQGAFEVGVYPWVRICRLEIRYADRNNKPISEPVIGTGWFAGPKTIITAGHNLYEVGWERRDRADGPAMGIMADIWIGYRQGNALGHVQSADFHVHDEWRSFIDTNPVESVKRSQLDLGCIQLSGAVFDFPRYFDLNAATNAELSGQAATISGYPTDIDGGEVQHRATAQIGEVSPTFFYHGIDTGRGQSGAPVWLGGTDVAQPSIVGIHTGGDDDERHNWALRMTPGVKAKIQQWVAENP
ncbi:serine protease [Sphingomonas sp. SUN039]|uniref:trypsin-like serine peptidase n=1 Tax=Sphingomonas sp. SUN039 TaxID=2937787 RepID=UPI0021647271|nr:trypsin-like serine protease [Sphingomonas sp. SUN039]UVO54920.1 trypsin-like serine protease [Sphingomonas sp. SUN039]